MKKIILASKSIDRGNLLRTAKIPFDFLVSNIDEEIFKRKISNPIRLVEELAKAKANKAKDKLLEEKRTDTIIIAADTIVELDGEIIGKAKDEDEAFHILRKLSNKEHQLITGLAITETTGTTNIITHDITKVKFLALTEDEIRGYIKTNEWKGRAGAYSIKDRASLFIEYIEGSPTNVVGLPLSKLFEILKAKFNLNYIKN